MSKTLSFHKTLRTIHPLVVLLLSIVALQTVIPTNLEAQNSFEEGVNWFQQRSAEADSFRVEPKYINNAINAFEQALEQDINTEQTVVYLLRSYYFKGMYAGLTTDQQQDVYDKGKALGERMMEQFPNSTPIKLWYGANSGRWVDVNGVWAAVRDGLANKLRDVGERIIELEPAYQGGGGYRILAQVHFHTPKIPLVMGWPSDEKALELVKKAMKIAPEHPSNLLLHARILLDFDRHEEAKTQLETILSLDPRPDFLVEDRYVQHLAQEMMRESF